MCQTLEINGNYSNFQRILKTHQTIGKGAYHNISNIKDLNKFDRLRERNYYRTPLFTIENLCPESLRFEIILAIETALAFSLYHQCETMVLRLARRHR